GLYANGAGGAIGVQNAATNLTWNGPITGSGSLIKSGAGTLTLFNSANTYAGGTFIEVGRLALGVGSAIPAGSDVTVQSGAIFDIGTLANTQATAIGTVTLNSGTLRAASPNGANYFLNKLVTDTTGGTIDATGSGLSTGLAFIGAGAGITVNGSSTWTGPASFALVNGNSFELPFTVPPNVT